MKICMYGAASDKINDNYNEQEIINITNIDSLEDKIITESKSVVNIETNYKGFSKYR